jgi:hypothetical protein
MFNGGRTACVHRVCAIVVRDHVGNVCLAGVVMTEIACRAAFITTNLACFGQRTTAAVSSLVNWDCHPSHLMKERIPLRTLYLQQTPSVNFEINLSRNRSSAHDFTIGVTILGQSRVKNNSVVIYIIM